MKKHDASGGDWIHFSVELHVKKDDEVYKLAEKLSRKTGKSIEEELELAIRLGCIQHAARNLKFLLIGYNEEV